jgi:hypothetical protein
VPAQAGDEVGNKLLSVMQSKNAGLLLVALLLLLRSHVKGTVEK